MNWPLTSGRPFRPPSLLSFLHPTITAHVDETEIDEEISDGQPFHGNTPNEFWLLRPNPPLQEINPDTGHLPTMTVLRVCVCLFTYLYFGDRIVLRSLRNTTTPQIRNLQIISVYNRKSNNKMEISVLLSKCVLLFSANRFGNILMI